MLPGKRLALFGAFGRPSLTGSAQQAALPPPPPPPAIQRSHSILSRRRAKARREKRLFSGRLLKRLVPRKVEVSLKIVKADPTSNRPLVPLAAALQLASSSANYELSKDVCFKQTSLISFQTRFNDTRREGPPRVEEAAPPGSARHSSTAT